MLSMSYKIRYDMTKRNEAIAILTGGGPAPGMNTVVGSVAKTFLQKVLRPPKVLGLQA